VNPSGVLTLFIGTAGAVVAASTFYLLLLAATSWFHRPKQARSRPRHRLVVLIPAHNEAEMISRCVRSFAAQGYPADLFRLVVIADNCDDETSARAASAGAEVIVRDEPGSRGKGHALRWAMDRILAAPSPPDAIVVVDADSIVESHFLAELEAALQSGSQVVQADDLVLPTPKSLRSVLEAAALLLRNRVRFAGRAVLGLPASLCGNGMLISRTVLDRHPWNAFRATEDGEYAIGLRLARVRTAFAQNARVLAAPTSGEIGAYTQGLRWEAGRFYLARRWIWPVLRAVLFDRRFDLLDLLVDLAVMPLGLLSAAAVLGTIATLALLAVHAIGAWPLIPWISATMALPTYVLLGLRGARAPSSFYRALLLAPLFMIRKLRIYAGLLHGSGNRWTRTQRPAEARGSKV
jgi:cellulose synthase/poly-beta-1,6-N-acetylglucosamine synthase-like glycosyltransferase